MAVSKSCAARSSLLDRVYPANARRCAPLCRADNRRARSCGLPNKLSVLMFISHTPTFDVSRASSSRRDSALVRFHGRAALRNDRDAPHQAPISHVGITTSNPAANMTSRKIQPFSGRASQPPLGVAAICHEPDGRVTSAVTGRSLATRCSPKNRTPPVPSASLPVMATSTGRSPPTRPVSLYSLSTSITAETIPRTSRRRQVHR